MKSVIETVNSNRAKVNALPSHYQMNVSDVFNIASSAGLEVNGKIYDAIEQAYIYGFVFGRRYEKNKNNVKG